MFCYSFTELTPNLTVPIPPERSNLVLRLSTLAESILTWSFISINLPKKLISVFEADQNPSLRPGASWKEVILNQEIPKLFFEVSTALTTAKGSMPFNSMIKQTSVDIGFAAQVRSSWSYVQRLPRWLLYCENQSRAPVVLCRPMRSSNVQGSLLASQPQARDLLVNVTRSRLCSVPLRTLEGAADK